MAQETPSALDRASLAHLEAALAKLEFGFTDLPLVEPTPANPEMAAVLGQVAERLWDNFPYFHPLYAGQMLKPPHPIARAAYALAMWINPNNHALDGGRASSLMEKEAVAGIAEMFGFEQHIGHLCGGGTMANLEALWVAGKLRPDETILASAQSHYTHERISGVLGLRYESVEADNRGRMDLDALRARLERGGVGTVVATLGTTSTGSIDPLPEILELQKIYGFRVHVDSAYGGYFSLVETLDAEARRAFAAIRDVDSVVIDPHKHGLQPYGCGCVIFRDPKVGALYKHDSPYTYFTSGELHLGEISLECSRPGAAAVGLWATMRMLPLVRGGEFAHGLRDSRKAALQLHAKLAGDERFVVPFPPELDIVVWAVKGTTTRDCTRLAREIFHEAGSNNLHLALAELPVAFFDFESAGVAVEGPTVTCLRSVLMKPEHLTWIDRIWDILSESTNTVVQ